MATRRDPTVVDTDGVRARIREFVIDDKRASAVIVELDGGARITLPTELLHHHDGGGYAVDAPWKSLVGGSPDVEIPIIEERVVVGVRSVPSERLRVRRRVVTEEQIVETPIWTEQIQVEHVPVGTFVDRAPPTRQEGDTLIIPCVEEVAVVETRLRVREELRIRVVRERRIDRQAVPVRRFEVEIEREHAPNHPPHPKKDRGGSS